MNLVQLNGNIKTTSNDLYLPSKTLAYGTYRLQLTVNLIDFPTISSVASIDIHIIRSEKWIVNLIEYGTSTITLGQYQELLLEPGLYSFDGDGNPLVPNVSFKISNFFSIFLFLLGMGVRIFMSNLCFERCVSSC